MANALRFPQQPHPEFFPTLRQRVQQYFNDKKVQKSGNATLYTKAIVLFLMYFGSYALILSQVLPGWAMLLLCAVMGFAACGLGTNVMHDALHNSYTSNKTVNTILGYTMEILGGSALTWKIQHNVLHHTYTNVYGMDEDIDDKPMLRLSPDGQLKWYHRFQHMYAIVLYGLSSVSWVVMKDFRQFANYWRNGMLRQLGVKPGAEFVKLIGTKVLYILLMLVLPLVVIDLPWYWILFGFLTIHFITGLLLTLIFLTAHAVEDAHHYQPDEGGNLENNWAIHQVMTTCNFKTRNPIVHWFVGGLNHQIEHHLFPNISHVHYAELSPIVKQTAHEFGLPYYEYKSFNHAIGSHFRYLREIGHGLVPTPMALTV
jgi:linoleoyl-CoA desaturase